MQNELNIVRSIRESTDHVGEESENAKMLKAAVREIVNKLNSSGVSSLPMIVPMGFERLLKQDVTEEWVDEYTERLQKAQKEVKQKISAYTELLKLIEDSFVERGD